MEVKRSQSSKPAVGFLDTPLEIRQQIYQYCLVSKIPLNLHQPNVDLYRMELDRLYICDKQTSLLLVSKQVGSEALEILYGKNVFQFHLHGQGGCCLKNDLTEANIGRIRRMEVVMQPYRNDYGSTLDSTLWSPILAKLTKLSIVAAQPRLHPETFGKNLHEQQMEKWTGWLKAVLQCIAPQLSSSCIVEVDDNYSKETRIVMKECLPSGFRNVQTLAGDLLFRRNGVSEE